MDQEKVGSILQQYPIADFVEWRQKKKLAFNKKFQRRNVWTLAAESFLINTILKGLPVPKVYMRTKIDLETQLQYREIIDGQQRIRAIIKFAKNELTLNKRGKEFRGKKFLDLSEDLQQSFLSYPIGVEQLINASDNEVIDIFARLNSYTVPLNAAELRHAKYQGNFKWTVFDMASKWSRLWDDLNILTARQRIRMEDDAFIAEMFGVFLEGVVDGGAKGIDKLYKEYDPLEDIPNDVSEKINRSITFILDNFKDVIGDGLRRPPHFLMLFAAISHCLYGIPKGSLEDGQYPEDTANALSDIEVAKLNLEKLDSIIISEEPESNYKAFWEAARGTTHRMKSRGVRFITFYKALMPRLMD